MTAPNPRRILTAEQVDLVLEWREAGAKFSTIQRRLAAQDCVISIGALSWTCLKNGVDLHIDRPVNNNQSRNFKRNGHAVRSFDTGEDARLQQLDMDGVAIADIARLLGRNRSSIYNRLATLARHDDRRERVGSA